MADMYRQGDLLFVQLAQKPNFTKFAKARPDGVVEFGETTGHAHRFVGDAEIIDDQGQAYARVGAATLEHEEHDTITLPQGWYRVRRQQEYLGPEQTRNVTD